MRRSASRAQTAPRRRGILGRCAEGFTLIELMIVLAILGILASIAIPSFTKFRLRSQRSEAYMALKAINIAQRAYYSEVGGYASSYLDSGFLLAGGTPIGVDVIDGNYYRFELSVFPQDGNPIGNFSVTATADLIPGDAIFDILLIENNVIIKN